MPCTVESASLEPKYGNKFIAGGEDMWIRVFDFHTGNEISTCSDINSFSSNIYGEIFVYLKVDLALLFF